MAKLPSSFRTSNRTTRQFRELYTRLPKEIKELTRSTARLFHNNPEHPSLLRHELKNRRDAKHAPGSFSISITMQYRAIYITVDGVNIWYWIGTHAEYDRFAG